MSFVVVPKKSIIRAVEFKFDVTGTAQDIESIVDLGEVTVDINGKDVLVHGWNHKQDYISVTVEPGDWFVYRGDGKFRCLSEYDFRKKYGIVT